MQTPDSNVKSQLGLHVLVITALRTWRQVVPGEEEDLTQKKRRMASEEQHLEVDLWLLHAWTSMHTHPHMHVFSQTHKKNSDK